MTRLGKPIPPAVEDIRKTVTELFSEIDYRVIDASSKITGRDFLLKIWRLIASTPLSIGICHEEIPEMTQANIYYELGVAQALGKETLLIKSSGAKLPSDLIRTEYIEFNSDFRMSFTAYLDSLSSQADHYEMIANQLDKNPILAIDYLKRAYLISGEKRLRRKARDVLEKTMLDSRAKNSVEFLAASF